MPLGPPATELGVAADLAGMIITEADLAAVIFDPRRDSGDRDGSGRGQWRLIPAISG